MKKILSIFLLAFSGLVQAACPNFVDGTVLTSAALNSAFAAPCITGGQINGAQIGNVAPASGAFSSIANSGGYTQTGTAENNLGGGLIVGGVLTFQPGIDKLTGIGTIAGQRINLHMLTLDAASNSQTAYAGQNIYRTDASLELQGSSGVSIGTGGITSLWVSTGNKVILGSTTDNGVDELQINGSLLGTAIKAGSNYILSCVMLFSSTAPTIASGFGTTPSIVNSNGTASFAVNVGTGGTASSGILTLPAATTNWNCAVINSLSGAGTLTQQSAHTSTSVTLTNYTISTDVAVAWTASYVIELNCVAK